MLIWFAILTIVVVIPTTIIVAVRGKMYKQREDYKNKYYAPTEETLIKVKYSDDSTKTWLKWEYEVNGKKYHHREIYHGGGAAHILKQKTVYYKKSNPRKRYDNNTRNTSFIIIFLLIICILVVSYYLNLLFPLGENGIFDDLK